MECFLSTGQRTKKAPPAYEQGASKFLGGIEEKGQISSADKSKVQVQHSSTWSPSGIDQNAYADPNAPLEKYDELTWRGYILWTLSEARNILAEYDLTIESLVQTEVTLVVDDCHRYSGMQISAILITVGVLISLFNAINARLLITFMTHQNPERGEFTEEEQAAAKFLDDIYFLGSSSEVVTALRADNVPALIKENKLKGEGMTTLKEEVEKIMNDPKTRASQRHPRILALIRDTRYDYSDPYEASDLDFKKWAGVYEQARATDAKQKKAERSKDTTGAHGRTKTIIPTAAQIDQSDFDHIVAELGKVEGGGDENSIQTAHFTANPQSGTAKRQQDLDDKMEGKKDIYDYMSIDINEYLFKFLSPIGLIKLLFSEDRRIDAIKSKSSRPFYGKNKLIRERGLILIPTTEEVRITFYGQAKSEQNNPKKGSQGNIGTELVVPSTVQSTESGKAN
ncbi:hypothetical protein DL98DRAFT_538556 [Cadophora sp. DSE1049]|nr:hypothetical protein DL98DRAFT_538556 [Cadophora sp. DSE1049]